MKRACLEINGRAILIYLILADKIKADLEMHDRLIAATSKKYKAPLLTKDEVIIASDVVKTVW